MTILNCSVIPAHRGNCVVYEDAGEIWVGEEILAWRITSYIGDGGKGVPSDTVVSTVSPIIADGEVCSTGVGYLKPDGTVSIFEGGDFRSLEAAAIRRAPKSVVVR